MTKAMNRWLMPLGAILLLLLLVAWMAGYFTEKIAPGTAAPQVASTGDAVAVLEQTAGFTERVPASVAA